MAYFRRRKTEKEESEGKSFKQCTRDNVRRPGKGGRKS